MRCNNRDDLLHRSFTLKIWIFSEIIEDFILLKNKAADYIHKKAPS